MPKGTDFNLVDILTAAAEHYPDGMVGDYWRRNLKTDNKVLLRRNLRGDTLAKFIAIEIVETYESKKNGKEKIDIAIHALEGAIRDIGLSIKGLEELRRNSG